MRDTYRDFCIERELPTILTIATFHFATFECWCLTLTGSTRTGMGSAASGHEKTGGTSARGRPGAMTASGPPLHLRPSPRADLPPCGRTPLSRGKAGAYGGKGPVRSGLSGPPSPAALSPPQEPWNFGTLEPWERLR